MANASQLRSGDLKADSENRELRFLDVLANKLNDELVGRLSELAEHKIGQLTFHFAALKLGRFSTEVAAFTAYIIKTKIRDKRNRDVSHKQAPGQTSDQPYLHIKYRVLLGAIALALRLMKQIDRHVLGPASVFLWQQGRKKRYHFLVPPKAGYMILPYVNLAPDVRLTIVQQELAESREVFSEIPTMINGQPATILACKKWGVIALGNRLMALPTYPLIKLDNVSIGPQANPASAGRS